MTEAQSIAVQQTARPTADPLPHTAQIEIVVAFVFRPAHRGHRQETDESHGVGIVETPVDHIGDPVGIGSCHRHRHRGMQDLPRLPARAAHEVGEPVAQRMEFRLRLLRAPAGPTALGGIHVEADLPQAVVPHQRRQVVGVVQQAFAIGHDHRIQPDASGVGNDPSERFHG